MDPNGALFPFVDRASDTVAGPHYTTKALNARLKEELVAAGLPSDHVSIHSFRRGRRTDLRSQGATSQEANERLRWAENSRAAQRYDARGAHDFYVRDSERPSKRRR